MKVPEENKGAYRICYQINIMQISVKNNTPKSPCDTRNALFQIEFTKKE